MADRPPRPRSADPHELGFVPERHMVQWLSPAQLGRTGLRVVLSELFGTFSDKREIEASLPEAALDSFADEPDLWIDFVADLGDAFEPTYTIASLLAQDELDLGPAGQGPRVTPRGRILVMGGDEVYPTSSTTDYENKTLGPYRSALPHVDVEADAPSLYVIPGNHDWYDGLTAFLRVFCRRQWIGGWQTRQSRSYFAAQLPHRWWLWGIDAQFDSWIDEPQFRYFLETVGAHVHPGDSVILCAPTPSWVYSNQGERPEAYVTLDYFERNVVAALKAEVRLTLTGDAHHYARYRRSDGGTGADAPQRITAGGGGAFLSATDHLPPTLELPPGASRDPGKSSATHWTLERSYPTKGDSARLRWRTWQLPFLNRGMWALFGVVDLLYAWTAQSALRSSGGLRFSDVMARLSYSALARGLAHSPLAIILTVALLGGLVGFTKSRVGPKRWVLGLGHGAVQLGAIAVAICATSALSSALELSGLGFLAFFVVVLGTGGGLLGCWVLAAYLLVAGRFRLNDNELFSAQRNRDWKNFIRLHLGPDGVVTVHPVGVDRTPRKFRLRAGDDVAGSWFESDDGPVMARLIEEPFQVTPATRPPGPPAPAPAARPPPAGRPPPAPSSS